MPYHDPIVGEIHEFRAQHAAKFGHDVRAIVQDLIHNQREAKAKGKQFVKSPGKRCKPGFRYTPIEEETPTAVSPISTFPLASESASSTPSS